MPIKLSAIVSAGLLAVSLMASQSALAGGHEKDAEFVGDFNPNKIHHRLNSGPPELNPAAAAAHSAPTAGTTATLSLIKSHGGPVMAGAPDIHLIWYGNWNQSNGSDTPAGQQIVRDFMNALSGSPYLKINTLNGAYTGSGATKVSGTLGRVLEGQATSGTAYSKSLSDANIKTVVQNYVNTAGGAQANAVYFVLTSSDVNESSGFCSQYCGWHSAGTVGGVANVKYSFVGNANRCVAGCAAQSVSPNANAGVDGMVSVLAHELNETLSDPLLNAWYDNTGAENGDKCAWTFGAAQTRMASGAYYNVTLGSRNYLIQRNLAPNSKCYIDGTTLQQ